MTSSFPSSETPSIIPAELSFLAIYNPSLADNDDNLRDQIVFYTSRDSHTRRKRRPRPEGDEAIQHEEENEKLRQVGLAQGMVNFARNFSDGNPVDTIETEKSRIVLHEFEPGWWILASIRLTRLPSARASSDSEAKVEYSSREVAPPQLLLRQLTRAHSIFLLHHAASLSELFSRCDRKKFCDLLERFWSRFVWNWDVLLHGNPAVEIFNGTKLAAGGELGIGVGEEEWGSGEREVLEDFVSRTEGLVDLVVSRFGDEPKQPSEREQKLQQPSTERQVPWLGAGLDARPSDGILFSGVGALSKRSLATVSHWMEWIHKYGQDAYGVNENPSSSHRRRRRKGVRDPQGQMASDQRLKSQSPSNQLDPGRAVDSVRRTAIWNQATSPGIPPPIVRGVDKSLENATAKVDEDAQSSGPNGDGSQPPSQSGSEASASGTETMVKYLTLGYGSAWSLTPKTFNIRNTLSRTAQQQSKEENETDNAPQAADKDNQGEKLDDSPLQNIDPTPEVSDEEQHLFKQLKEESIGKFLIGLVGDLEDEDDGETDSADRVSESDRRILLRTITIATERKVPGLSISADADDNSPSDTPVAHHKAQVAVYVHQPFMFTFIFALHTSSLTYPSFYRSVHHQLGPLQRPLLNSTDPAKVALRIEAAMGSTQSIGSSTVPSLHDLVFDPRKITVHTSIANIPVPGTLAAEGLLPSSSGSWLTLGIPTGSSSVRPIASQSASLSPWSRVDALNVHTQILNTYFATRCLPHEIERTSKTSRGWWVLWMRIPQSSKSGIEDNEPREAFLVRQASDATNNGKERRVPSKGGWFMREREVSGSDRGAGNGGGSRVAEGIGVDARRWVEGLLALNR